MSKTPVQIWVEALRSGEYKQGQEYLNLEGYFCCLGVACDLYKKHVDESFPAEEIFPREAIRYSKDKLEQALPMEVASWLGFEETNDVGSFNEEISVPVISEEGENFIVTGTNLADLNDRGADFETIAKIIESRPEGLFKDD